MVKKLRFLIYTQYYPPEIGAPQTRLSELASGLANNGFQVSILTAMPNYPTGKIYSGYSGIYRKENIKGIQVYRSFIFPSQSHNLIKRLINYFSFISSSFIVGVFLPKPEYLLTESPPLFLGISGYLLSKIKGSKWIFNVADLWPASAVELGVIRKNSTSEWIGTKLETIFYKKAWLVTGQSKTILQSIVERFPTTHVYHLSNGVNSKYFQTEPNENHSEKIKVLYAGLHGIAQGLDQILLAAQALTSNRSIEFNFYGDGPEKKSLMKLADELDLSNVSFHDPVQKNAMPALLAEADILLVPLKIQLTGAVPSKLYESMAARKPVLLIAESEAAEIVSNNDCGIVVTPGYINGIIEGILTLSNNKEERIRLGDNGCKAVKEKYEREVIIHQFCEYLRNNV